MKWGGKQYGGKGYICDMVHGNNDDCIDTSCSGTYMGGCRCDKKRQGVINNESDDKSTYEG